MKKIFAMLLALTMCISMAACGSSDGGNSAGNSATATITTNEDETVNMTAAELMEAFDSNEAKFNKLYRGAKIQFTGTIDSIATNVDGVVKDGLVYSGLNKIVFKEGWCLVVGKDNMNIDLADFDTNEKVTVTTGIVGSPYNSDFLKAVCDGNRVVWLVGDDLIHHEQINDITTTIETE